jgi:hypothetical protein
MVPVTLVMPIPVSGYVVVMVIMGHKAARVIIPVARIMPVVMTMSSVMAMVAMAIVSATIPA